MESAHTRCNAATFSTGVLFFAEALLTNSVEYGKKVTGRKMQEKD